MYNQIKTLTAAADQRRRTRKIDTFSSVEEVSSFEKTLSCQSIDSLFFKFNVIIIFATRSPFRLLLKLKLELGKMSILQATSSENSITQFRVVEACDYGKQFAGIFYEKLDKGRHSLNKLFHENATLIWNGNHVFGLSKIAEFFENLPTSETELGSVDSQPVLDLPQMQGKKMMTITVSGRIHFKGTKAIPFTEVFTMVAEPGSEKNVWKIVSDTYRSL